MTRQLNLRGKNERQRGNGSQETTNKQTWMARMHIRTGLRQHTHRTAMPLSHLCSVQNLSLSLFVLLFNTLPPPPPVFFISLNRLYTCSKQWHRPSADSAAHLLISSSLSENCSAAAGGFWQALSRSPSLLSLSVRPQ